MQHISPNTIEHKQELLVRVERNERMVQRLSEKLNSYTFEPKCPQRFEKFYELNRHIQEFRKHQNRLLSKIRNQKVDLPETHTHEIESHLDRFKVLESEFAAYLFDLKKPL
ncbi:hypothetical protein GUA46_07945 [Muricauda sp. HICW]|uniref:Uncharacterized protein n=1 Tax=Flagellimonas chongwuensis TaxID=2697365 RepID=A0A850NEI4_9FLAO|nr:hypothetical protein [Allomuricauda chongwuensis]NVN18269.1 hypothetical protein [Allomuricauda chongwuensis]